MYVYVHTHICTKMYIYIHKCVHHTYIHIYIHVYINKYVYIYKYMKIYNMKLHVHVLSHWPRLKRPSALHVPR